MEVKLIEIRDYATFIPAIAIALVLGDANRIVEDSHEMHEREAEKYLLRRAGYSDIRIVSSTDEPYILLTNLNGGTQAHYDEYAWPNRTMRVVHHYLIHNWLKVRSGDVVDVEFINGGTTEPKNSERFEHPV